VRWDEHAWASAELLRKAATAIPADAVAAAAAAIAASLEAGGALYTCGNGGSAADAMHIAAELVGRFRRERPGLRAMALCADPAFLTAWGNDHAFDDVFARAIQAWGRPGDVLLGLTTSGRSRNVLAAFARARAAGLVTVALTGEGGAALAGAVDHLLLVPSPDTALVQQVHIALYHVLCGCIEERLSGESPR
jgi:D-sedoheptulose 7-phosphate isomerase